MPVPNIVNVVFPSSIGDNTVLAGIPKTKIRTRQLNIQNQDDTLETTITIKSDSEDIIGPIIIQAKQLLSLELASEEHEKMLTLESGDSLIVESSVDVPLLVFGYIKQI